MARRGFFATLFPTRKVPETHVAARSAAPWSTSDGSNLTHPHTRVNFFTTGGAARNITRKPKGRSRTLTSRREPRAGFRSVDAQQARHERHTHRRLAGVRHAAVHQRAAQAPLLRSECLRMPPRHPRSRFAWFRVCLTRADASARRRSRPDARVFARETCLLRKPPARASPPSSPPPSRPD